MPRNTMENAAENVAVVVIGRNEGDRLKRCLWSLPAGVAGVVYVDSGSTDGSVEFARSTGATVVELDMSVPFTAARARNAGFERAMERHGGVSYVQFIDGDCELADGWIRAALHEIEAGRSIAVVCGRRREMFPDASAYNRLCDMEWDTPVGDADACGGDALFRVAAFRDVGGFDPTLIAGEEPELCLRLRRVGYRVRRIAHEMTRHDADMHRLSQWWRRNVRAGHAYAELQYLHRDGRERYELRPVLSDLAWGVLVPGASLLLAPPTLGASLSLSFLYAGLYRRVRAHRIERGDSPEHAALYARYVVLGKFAEAQGILRYYANRVRRRRSGLIEYK